MSAMSDIRHNSFLIASYPWELTMDWAAGCLDTETQTLQEAFALLLVHDAGNVNLASETE